MSKTFVVQWQQNPLIIENVHLNLEFPEVMRWQVAI